MCDTMVTVSSDGVMFAKNSDRDPNEAQLLEWHPRRISTDVTATVECTYQEIPEVATTWATVLSRPWWMFGAEMGVNEHGVVIGNEAVYTTQPSGPPALLGMDVVRLALERSRSASDAVQVMIELLEAHGQGGPCSYERPTMTYDNSFLVADSREAYVLETAGQFWATEQVSFGARSISNGLTIPGFAEEHSRSSKAAMVRCALRQNRTTEAARHAHEPRQLMEALRDHGRDGGPYWTPLHGSLHAPCVHAGGLVNSSQTTGSLVVDLRSSVALWATATAAPCASIFKPVDFGSPVDLGAAATNCFDPEVAWWRHEEIQRSWWQLPLAVREKFTAERDALEREWLESPPPSAEAFDRADQVERHWRREMAGQPRSPMPDYVQWRWDRANQDAHLPTKNSGGSAALGSPKEKGIREP